jgi:hypothetical protein
LFLEGSTDGGIPFRRLLGLLRRHVPAGPAGLQREVHFSCVEADPLLAAVRKVVLRGGDLVLPRRQPNLDVLSPPVRLDFELSAHAVCGLDNHIGLLDRLILGVDDFALDLTGLSQGG